MTDQTDLFPLPLRMGGLQMSTYTALAKIITSGFGWSQRILYQPGPLSEDSGN